MGPKLVGEMAVETGVLTAENWAGNWVEWRAVNWAFLMAVN